MAARKTSAKAKPAAKKPAAKDTATKTAAAKKSAAKAPAAKAKAKPKPAPNMNERMEGLQGWMAEIERKQERMTKLGGGAAILAVVLSGGALALGIINKQDASSKNDVDNLTEQVNELGASIKTDTEDQLSAINGRIDAIDQQVKTIQQTQTTQTQDIAALKSQQQAAGAVGGQQNGLDLQPGVTPDQANPDGN